MDVEAGSAGGTAHQALDALFGLETIVGAQDVQAASFTGASEAAAS